MKEEEKEYKIEKEIPIPINALRKAPYNRKYPFREMEIGDSILIKNKASGHLTGNLRRLSILTGFKFTTRKENIFDVRVWRIK